MIVILDDTDPSIQYSSSQWSPGGGPGEYNTTTHGTLFSGSTITIPFSGTAIQVFGTVTAAGGAFPDPVSTYSIDNGALTYFSPNSTGWITSPTMQRFFTSQPLSDGNHTLSITSTVQGSHFWFDYAVYTLGKSPAASSSAPAPIVTVSIAAGKLSVEPGQLVGGALGLFIVTVLLCCAIFYWYLRRRMYSESSYHRQSSIISPKVYSMPAILNSPPVVSASGSRTFAESYVRQLPTRQPRQSLAFHIPPAYEA